MDEFQTRLLFNPSFRLRMIFWGNGRAARVFLTGLGKQQIRDSPYFGFS